MRCSSGQGQIVLVVLIVLHILIVQLHRGDGGGLWSAAKRNGLSVVNILIVRVRVAIRALGVGFLILLQDLFGNGLGPLNVLGLLGCLVGTADGVVEPAFLFPLGIRQIEHQAIEEIGVTDQNAEVMVRPGSLLGELATGGVSEVVGLRDAHLLLLGRWG